MCEHPNTQRCTTYEPQNPCIKQEVEFCTDCTYWVPIGPKYKQCGYVLTHGGSLGGFDMKLGRTPSYSEIREYRCIVCGEES